MTVADSGGEFCKNGNHRAKVWPVTLFFFVVADSSRKMHFGGSLEAPKLRLTPAIWVGSLPDELQVAFWAVDFSFEAHFGWSLDDFFYLGWKRARRPLSGVLGGGFHSESAF